MADDPPQRRKPETSRGARDFVRGPLWVSATSLRPGEIEALADKFADRPFEEMLRDRDFVRLTDEDRSALAAEFRRRASVARAEAEGDEPRGLRRANKSRRTR
jgi:hypothetical protein